MDVLSPPIVHPKQQMADGKGDHGKVSPRGMTPEKSPFWAHILNPLLLKINHDLDFSWTEKNWYIHSWLIFTSSKTHSDISVTRLLNSRMRSGQVIRVLGYRVFLKASKGLFLKVSFCLCSKTYELLLQDSMNNLLYRVNSLQNANLQLNCLLEATEWLLLKSVLNNCNIAYIS